MTNRRTADRLIPSHRCLASFLFLPAALAFFAAAMLPTSVAHAFDLQTPVSDSLGIVETLQVIYNKTDPDKDLHFWATVNHFNLTLVKAQYTAGVRYDTEAYFLTEEYRIKYGLEKAFAQYEDHGFFVRAGDFYNRMGNGLVLSIVKREQFGLDNTLRGGIVQYGDRGGYFEARVLGGSVNEYDGSSFTPDRATRTDPSFDFDKGVLPEEEDQIYGGQIVLGKPGWGFLEGRYLGGLRRLDPALGFQELEKDDPFNIVGVGARWLNFGGHGGFAGEYAWYDLSDEKKDMPAAGSEGRGAYGRVNLNFGRFTFLAEGQDYFRFTFPWAEPPILEFEKQTFGHTPDREDILGARGYAEFLVPKIETSVFFNYYNAQRHKEAPLDLRGHYRRKDLETWVSHPYGGFEKVFDGGAHFLGSGGYRKEPEGRWVHFEFDEGFPVASNHEISFALRVRQFHGMGFFQGSNYGTYSAAPTWNFSPWLSVTARNERSDEPLATGTGAAADDNPDFWSGEATVHAGKHVDVRLFYGRIRGGLVCSGGVCRNIPPFDGALTELTLRF